MKKCFKCKRILTYANYYKHSEMADGYLGKCKSCTKKDVNKRYYDPVARERIIAYEKAREQTKERKEKKLQYQRNRRAKHKGKDLARSRVSRAIATGKIIKKPCEICGDVNVEAHHDDYRKHLAIRWLCRKHHMEVEGKITYLK